ncbi:unnamed protein product [Protopolystoma xenopodis]|uniref:Uncharacterized protein n=1 Tax=Protopolystoma xenopodis TaxID=117903 RepID=A0A3S5BH51_9PLAT|nr:unnamed protein product [Protopolystoma xenopodis]
MVLPTTSMLAPHCPSNSQRRHQSAAGASIRNELLSSANPTGSGFSAQPSAVGLQTNSLLGHAGADQMMAPAKRKPALNAYGDSESDSDDEDLGHEGGLGPDDYDNDDDEVDDDCLDIDDRAGGVGGVGITNSGGSLDLYRLRQVSKAK